MNHRLPRALVASAVALLLACDDAPPRPQWRVHVGTDATVPNFGDRVRVDAIGADGAVRPGATQIFDVSTPSAFPLSFGVTPGSGVAQLRVRLYRAEATDISGEPLDPLVDLVGSLPDVGEGISDVRAVLGMSCFGKPSEPVSGDAAASACDPATGELAPIQAFPSGTELPTPGSWGPSSAPCPSAPDGMACVEGATFLLGSRTYVPFGPEFDPVPQQLVHVPTFALDVDEVTVGAWRKLVDAGMISEPVATSSLADDSGCAWTKMAGPNEALPMNCLRQAEAAAGCAAMGKRLPTEAEWEFAAGGRTDERAFPFPGKGTTEEICESALIAVAKPLQFYGSRQCIAVDPELPDGLVPGGSAEDVNALGLRNMGGSVAEWTADAHVPLTDDACWGQAVHLHEDPLCDAASATGVVKGGSYIDIAYDAHVYFRRAAGGQTRVSHIGVRCAKDL